MSIAILTQVYDEMRRLAIAGSVVAPGDFRLKKLIPQLEQIGAKAPVFAKVGDMVKAVVEAKDDTSAPALLDLSMLVIAILYTQGETGLAGSLEPIESIDLGVAGAQASARVLKPLVEALTTTGSGRLEVIREAHERGAFRDLRLVRPALDALDDPYPEIVDFMADKVLPLYGKAILAELRAKFDLKGRAGHPRRLQLMHARDPAGTRDLVKQALDSGSKEVKVVAIACLGAAPDDLSYLLEQAGAKAQEVRQAAYRALATIDDGAALAVLEKVIAGKDLDLASDSLQKSRNPKLLSYLIAGVEAELAALRKNKWKKEAGPIIVRLVSLLNCLTGRTDENTEAVLVRVFAARAELAKFGGVPMSGADLNSAVVRLMGCGSEKLRTLLVEAHASLWSDDLPACFSAARHGLPADQVFALFSPYLTAKVDARMKQRDPAWAKREAILDVLRRGPHNYERSDEAPALDPRWLDLAVRLKHLGLVRHLIRPGHAGANALLKATFDEVLAKAKQPHDCHEVLDAMVHAADPEATDAFIAVLEKFAKKFGYFDYYFGNLIVDLPKAALPRLEALIPKLDEKLADSLLGYIQELRAKVEAT